TRLGDAIADAVGGGQAPPQAVLVLTDGQATAGRSLAEGADAARAAATPLYLVGVGSPEAPAEAWLADLVADETAFVDDLVTFEATLSSRGLQPEDGGITVELLRSGADGPVATARVTPGVDGSAAVRLVDRPTEPGEYRYTLRIAEGPAPTDQTARPPLTHKLRVRDDAIRVLLAAGYPNYEYRYLKHLLERDESIRVATHLQDADPEYSAADLTALPGVPTTEEGLAEFDVLVLIDLDPTLLPRSLWKRVGDFVSERGGGVVLVAGPRSLPVAYRTREEFAALSPTDLGAAAPAAWDEPAGFRVTPTALGEREPALRLGDATGEGSAAWNGLAPLYWRADIGPPKPASRVLARTAGGAEATPILVSHYYGAGRVLMHAVDSTWRWRYRVGDVYFARYWVQTLRSLARGKRDTAATGAELFADRRAYRPGEPVVLRLRDNRPAREAGAQPAVVLQAAGRPDRRVALAPAAAGGKRFRTTLRDLPPGEYRALLAETGGEPIAAEFRVEAPPGETARPEMNRAGLAAAAERSRGAYFNLSELVAPDGKPAPGAATRLADALPVARPSTLETLPPIDLWNRWPLLLGITLSLTAEWVLRKRRAML
ncbi:MAG: hypothetical protein AAF805_04605, partial [Planctomycetota bacterium]